MVLRKVCTIGTSRMLDFARGRAVLLAKSIHGKETVTQHDQAYGILPKQVNVGCVVDAIILAICPMQRFGCTENRVYCITGKRNEKVLFQ